MVNLQKYKTVRLSDSSVAHKEYQLCMDNEANFTEFEKLTYKLDNDIEIRDLLLTSIFKIFIAFDA